MGQRQGPWQALQYPAGVVEPALRAAAGRLGRWFVWVAVLPVCGDFQRRRQHSATTAHRALPVCGRSALGMPWGTASSTAAFAVCSRRCGACTGGCGRAAQVNSWGCGLPVCGYFQRTSQHSATIAHRALPVCEWSALGMPWGTARSNAASAVCSRCGGACTGGCGRAGQQVVCGDCGFAGLWRFPEEEAALSKHSAQSPGSV